MTAQKFELVFQKISLSLPLLEAFQGTEVRKLTIHKKERTVSIEIAANKMIPLQKQEELKGALLESLPGIQAVSLAVFYEPKKQDLCRCNCGRRVESYGA